MIPEKACPRLDRGLTDFFGQDHAPRQEDAATETIAIVRDWPDPRDQSDSLPTTSSASESELVSPGDSMPNSCTIPGNPCSAGPSTTKSAAGSPGPVSLGRTPA